MKKKRIAIIINGGIGVGFGSEGAMWLVELCEKIAQQHDLTVFSFVEIDKGYQPKDFKLTGVPLGNNSRWVILRFTYLFFRVLGLHFQKRFQIIHGFWAFPAGFLALILSKTLNIKSLITFMGGEVSNIKSINYGLFQGKFTSKLIKFTAQHVDCVVAQTNHHAAKLSATIAYKNRKTISFGVDLTKFPPIEKSLQPPYQFLYLGDINRVKDLPSLIKTFELISKKVEARLDIVGGDRLNGEIQHLVNQLNLQDKVLFQGRQLNHHLTQFLQKAHILLHTSLSEGQAVVINEAIASGVVVCGTRVGIIEDLEHKITTVVDVGDAEGLTQKVLNLLNNPEKYDELREKGIAWSQENDLIAQSNKYIKLYQSLIEN